MSSSTRRRLACLPQPVQPPVHVGSPLACSRIWSRPARSPFRNLITHSSPRQSMHCRGLECCGSGEMGMAAMARLSGERLQDVLGSAVKVDWVVNVSSQRIFCLIEVASVLEGSC